MARSSATALTIAGSDPSGGAGLQADLKTFHQHGVYGMGVVTLLTVQNTQQVARVQLVESQLVREQLEAVLDDIPPAAAKTGALGGADNIAAVAASLAERQLPLVVDPVMVSKHGAPLLPAEAVDALVRHLLPLATLVTPNLPEASVLSGRPVEQFSHMQQAAAAIVQLGARSVLVKGGHLNDDPVDLLLADGQFHELREQRIATRHTHGTGCVYAASVTARLARGESILEAVTGAKRFVTEAIRSNPGLGHGQGPTNMFSCGSRTR